MPYPKKNLNANETVALDLHPHWWFFAHSVIAVVLSLALALLILVKMDDGGLRTGLTWIAVGLIVASAIWLIIRYLKWISTNFVITSDRIIFRQGMLSKSGIEIPLERVNNVNFHQGVFERFLGAGDLLIESGGEDGQQRFTDVRKPQSVQNLIHTQVEAKLHRRGGHIAAGAGQSFPPPPPAVDVAGQLERLEGLWQRGSLTQEEFEIQKQRLLGS